MADFTNPTTDQGQTVDAAMAPGGRERARLRENLLKAVSRAEDWAGTMPAKEAVKLRPSDWHAICDTAREAAAALTADPAAEANRDNMNSLRRPCGQGSAEGSDARQGAPTPASGSSDEIALLRKQIDALQDLLVTHEICTEKRAAEVEALRAERDALKDKNAGLIRALDRSRTQAARIYEQCAVISETYRATTQFPAICEAVAMRIRAAGKRCAALTPPQDEPKQEGDHGR